MKLVALCLEGQRSMKNLVSIENEPTVTEKLSKLRWRKMQNNVK